jgi:hypothetical protein
VGSQGDFKMEHHLFVAKGNAIKRYEEFTKYLDKELDILENIGYADSEIFLTQFPERAKTFVLGADRKKDYDSMKEFPRDVKDNCLVERVLYLSRVADYLKEKSQSGKYAPAEGSFWESIRKTLEKLALEVQKKLD